MAINQPPITGDPVVDAWMLEVTRELNGGTGVSTSTGTSSSSSSIIDRVDQSGVLRLNQGTLSNTDVVTSVQLNGGNLQTGAVSLTTSGSGLASLSQDDYLFRITDPGPNANVPVTYTVLDESGNPVNIPETHMLFLGGLRLCESTSMVTRDYTYSNNIITLERTSRDFIGLDLVLTVFSLS